MKKGAQSLRVNNELIQNIVLPLVNIEPRKKSLLKLLVQIFHVKLLLVPSFLDCKILFTSGKNLWTGQNYVGYERRE